MSFRRTLIALDDSAIAAHAVQVGTEPATALKAEAALVDAVDPALASAGQRHSRRRVDRDAET